MTALVTGGARGSGLATAREPGTLAIEWASHGIRVNAVAPGHTLRPMVEDAIAEGQMPAEELEGWCRRIPLGHRLAGQKRSPRQSRSSPPRGAS